MGHFVWKHHWEQNRKETKKHVNKCLTNNFITLNSGLINSLPSNLNYVMPYPFILHCSVYLFELESFQTALSVFHVFLLQWNNVIFSIFLFLSLSLSFSPRLNIFYLILSRTKPRLQTTRCIEKTSFVFYLFFIKNFFILFLTFSFFLNHFCQASPFHNNFHLFFFIL